MAAPTPSVHQTASGGAGYGGRLRPAGRVEPGQEPGDVDHRRRPVEGVEADPDHHHPEGQQPERRGHPAQHHAERRQPLAAAVGQVLAVAAQVVLLGRPGREHVPRRGQRLGLRVGPGQGELEGAGHVPAAGHRHQVAGPRQDLALERLERPQGDRGRADPAARGADADLRGRPPRRDPAGVAPAGLRLAGQVGVGVVVLGGHLGRPVPARLGVELLLDVGAGLADRGRQGGRRGVGHRRRQDDVGTPVGPGVELARPGDLGRGGVPVAPHPRPPGQPAAEQDAGDHHEDRQQRAGDGELQHRQGGRHLGRRLPAGAGRPAERGQVLGDVGRRDQQHAAGAPAGDPPGPRPVQEQGAEAEHPHPGQHVAGDQEPVRPEGGLVDALPAVELPPAQVQQGSADDDGHDGQGRQRGPGITGGTNPHDLPAPPQTPTGRARLAGSSRPVNRHPGWPLD